MDSKRIIAIVAGIVVLLVVFVGLLMPKGGPLPASGEVDNATFKAAIAAGARVIDVRTPLEYEGGHIKGAENVPIDQLTQAAAGWDKSTPIALYCQTGSRSHNGYAFLVGQGFTRVYNLLYGITKWDGEVVKGTGSGAAKLPATTLPTVYDFSSNT